MKRKCKTQGRRDNGGHFSPPSRNVSVCNESSCLIWNESGAIITTPSFLHYKWNYSGPRKEGEVESWQHETIRRIPPNSRNIVPLMYAYSIWSPNRKGIWSIIFQFFTARVISWGGAFLVFLHSANGKSIISSKTFVLAPTRKIRRGDETLPRVITRKCELCFTKNRYCQSKKIWIIFLTAPTISGGNIGSDIV